LKVLNNASQGSCPSERANACKSGTGFLAT
jgi:hypothetical protein